MVSYKILIGKKTQDRRVEMGFQTQEAMAKKLGTTQSQVARWEGGKNLPEGELRKAIGDVLKVDPSFFELIEVNGEIVNYNMNESEITKIAQKAAEIALNKKSNIYEIPDIKDKEKQALLSEFLTLLELLDRDNVVAMKDYVTRKITMLAGKSEKANKA